MDDPDSCHHHFHESMHGHPHPQMNVSQPIARPIALESIAAFVDVASHPHELAGLPEPELYDFRGALFAVLEDSTSETWSNAYLLPLISPSFPEPVTLWSAVLHYTGYNYSEHPRGDRWPIVPSSAQISVAIMKIFGPPGDRVKPREAGPWESDEF